MFYENDKLILAPDRGGNGNVYQVLKVELAKSKTLEEELEGGGDQERGNALLKCIAFVAEEDLGDGIICKAKGGEAWVAILHSGNFRQAPVTLDTKGGRNG